MTTRTQITLTLFAALTACAEPESSTPRTTRSDSAGIEIVASSLPAWSSGLARVDALSSGNLA